MTERPYLYIPPAAEPGQPAAFADRSAQVTDLTRSLAHAGNALRAGNRAVRHRRAVVGYMGVGKSALILEALRRLREPPADLKVQDPERWVILHFSGKHYRSFEALTDGLAQLDPDGAPRGGADPFEGFGADLVKQAEVQVPDNRGALYILHRALSKEARLFAEVREALEALRSAVAYVQTWRGAMLSRQSENSVMADQSRMSEAAFEAQIKGLVAVPNTPDANAGLKLAASILAKHGTALRQSERLEGRWRVSSAMLVDLLNSFFDMCTRAQIPTVLVLDDFDDFTSASGASRHDRARTLTQVLGTFDQFRPTALVIGLRKEYFDEEIRRGFLSVTVPPATPPEAMEMLRAWADAQTPRVEGAPLAELVALAQRLLSLLKADEPGVIPLDFFRLVAWLYQSGADASSSPKDLLQTWLKYHYDPFSINALRRAAERLPEMDVPRCLSASPIDPEPLGLDEVDTGALSQEGLWRAALASDASQPHVILDPLAAWLRRAT